MSRSRTRRLSRLLAGTLTTIALLTVTPSLVSADPSESAPTGNAEEAGTPQGDAEEPAEDAEGSVAADDATPVDAAEAPPEGDAAEAPPEGDAPEGGSAEAPRHEDVADDAAASEVVTEPSDDDIVAGPEGAEAPLAAPTSEAASTEGEPSTVEAAMVGPAPGNAGTVKIHRSTTADDDRRNEPKVCEFRIVGFGFPADANLEITIEGHGGPNAGPDDFAGTVTADQLSEEGDFAIAGPDLADGMYKLFVENTTSPGGSKQKVFKIDCGGEEVPDGPEELDRTLQLTKSVAGDGEPEDGDFTFDVDCGEAFDDTVSVEAGETVTVADDLPFGTSCTIEEIEARGADATAMAADPASAETARGGRSITVTTVEESISVAVTFTNTFNALPAILATLPEGGALPAGLAAPARVEAAGAQQLPRTGGSIADPAWLAGILIGLGTALRFQARRQGARRTA